LLDTLSSVVQQLSGNIAALFCDTPHRSCAILYGIGDGAGGTRSVVGGFGDVFGGSFQYGLGHGSP
jgi:hypothetical protein